MGKKKPSGNPDDPNYDPDFNPTYSYQKEWKGLIYDQETEDKMISTMNTSMDRQAQVFATKGTYLYYTRYYAMRNRMDELRRQGVLKSINKKMEDPYEFRSQFKPGFNLGVVNGTLGTAAIVGMVYVLRRLKA
mmetsp:Transcript_74694/g.118879  ORF Transcript_74694/g.118879 Transcript_74694/m.118879 type:complete len:133 (+) Transcript_74694:115-513(+)|eukprot:CAMPEP_0197027548 /NCGR_PEP_ID=MMETSP1384-20130603/7439_1 /TAXON_ID=29189 /ORGANISM="Ammonia sp." /LENGTH=132 /DNA_ID=CAMNT_0042456409 /DNA_START=112 /DNA_END=510 /DNA_ORIENTATION=-